MTYWGDVARIAVFFAAAIIFAFCLVYLNAAEF
jgi:hypothetical protein